MEIVYRYFCAQNKQTNTYNAVNAYMSYKALPVNLRDRIHLYLKFKYQGHFYKVIYVNNIKLVQQLDTLSYSKRAT